ncbi:MAG TPA: hypothetical protein VK892_18965 [Pyrinomonadaceae bacterium]|nr:hypothetical protein [Pyrinomonadaceae bacterium]
MKKNATNSKNTVSETEKGLKHLKLVGVGREYIEKRLAEMEINNKTSEPSLQSNEKKLKK